MEPLPIERLSVDGALEQTRFHKFLTLPRETIPTLGAREAKRTLEEACGRLGLDLVATGGVAPTFLALPAGGSAPRLLLLGTWHAEALPVTPASLEGAERLALVAMLAALESIRAEKTTSSRDADRVALIVSPGATMGSLVMLETLREYRERLQAPAAYWVRIGATSPSRRRIFLGSRGRVVLAIRGGETNPYRMRDQIVAELTDEAYGPRPLDFELLRKLGGSPEALGFLEETGSEIDSSGIDTEERFKRTLFAPSGSVMSPPGGHPERPRAWITIETAEGMEPDRIAERARNLAADSRVDLVESFPWDRLNLHHPALQALVMVAKSRSEGPEIWPAAPWVTPSGLFTRVLGVGLAEWAVPLPAGARLRLLQPNQLEAVIREVAELMLRALDAVGA